MTRTHGSNGAAAVAFEVDELSRSMKLSRFRNGGGVILLVQPQSLHPP